MEPRGLGLGSRRPIYFWNERMGLCTPQCRIRPFPGGQTRLSCVDTCWRACVSQVNSGPLSSCTQCSPLHRLPYLIPQGLIYSPFLHHQHSAQLSQTHRRTCGMWAVSKHGCAGHTGCCKPSPPCLSSLALQATRSSMSQ